MTLGMSLKQSIVPMPKIAKPAIGLEIYFNCIERIFKRYWQKAVINVKTCTYYSVGACQRYRDHSGRALHQACRRLNWHSLNKRNRDSGLDFSQCNRLLDLCSVTTLTATATGTTIQTVYKVSTYFCISSSYARD